MRIAFVGDIVGRPGRRAAVQLLPDFRARHGIDFLIVNLENAAGGFGLTGKAFAELTKTGADFYTSGNHIWDKREGVALLGEQENIIRPANYPGQSIGSGYRVIEVGDVSVAIFNLQGRVFMPPIDCPFRTIDRCLEEVDESCKIRVVDMHAEATSEKIAMAWYLDGRVTALVGTHTHVPTRDARVLPKGTAYVTDVGMTGSYDSVLGVVKDVVIERFLAMRPMRFTVARNDLRCDLVVIDVEESTGKAQAIEQHQLRVEES